MGDAWFAFDYLRTSSYDDMMDSTNYNYFSIAGHEDASRCFFANSNYGGCSVDAGWMVVAGRDNGCDWEAWYDVPDVMYSTASGKLESEAMAVADSMVVFYNWDSA